MKLKIGMSVLVAAMMTACGSSNTTTTPLSYTTTGTGINGYGSISTSFGSVTKNLLFPYSQTTLYNTKTFSETGTVAVGDLVSVNAYGAYEVSQNSHLGGIVTTTSVHALSSLTIYLNGSVLGYVGGTLYGQFVATSAGTITVSADWDGDPATVANVFLPGTGVSLVHCLNTSGAAITCPTGTSY